MKGAAWRGTAWKGAAWKGTAWKGTASVAARMLAATLALAGCAALGVLTAAVVRAAPDDEDLHAAPVAEVLVSTDGRTLTASAVGVCLPATALLAREDAAAVTVTLSFEPRTGACTSGTETRSYSATLHAPLGPREVIDSSDGLGVLVFDERRLLRPAALPAGYTHLYDAALYGDGSDGSDGSDWDATCIQLFADAHGDLLWISQTYGRHWPAGWSGSSHQLVPLLHAVARYRSGMLAWQENGSSYLIVSAPRYTATLTTAQLAAVARSLHGITHS